jgi:thymidine kinase
MNTITFNGQLHLILGNMFSGKTSELLRRYRRYKISGKSCIMIKYKNDTRYDPNSVVTHDSIQITAISCTLLSEVDAYITPYDVICVDEVQFYKDAPIFCDKWANEGKIVEACGLSGSYNRTTFVTISNLIPKAESVVFLDAICVNTGNNGAFTKLIVDNVGGSTELIGGADKYIPVDRLTYFGTARNYQKILLEELVELNSNQNDMLIQQLQKIDLCTP